MELMDFSGRKYIHPPRKPRGAGLLALQLPTSHEWNDGGRSPVEFPSSLAETSRVLAQESGVACCAVPRIRTCPGMLL